MKPLRLLTLTTLNYLVIFLVLTLFFFGVFYLITMQEVLRSTDEVLHNRKVHLQEWFIKSEKDITSEVLPYPDFSITPMGSSVVRRDYYSDTLIYETADQEWDEFRKLTSTLEWKGKPYRLDIVVARMETHEIVASILQSLMVVFVLMVAAFYFTTRYFSRKLWEPFYHTLQQLNLFEIDQSKELELRATRIEEFIVLNKSIVDLTNRTRSTFHNQKQFIENASHEMQTPLAIAQSKLELLIEDPHLTEQQAEIIQTLIHSTQRLARLNKTLLLLSKIDNQQFLEKEVVLIKPLLDEIMTNFEEQQENFKIHVETKIKNESSWMANKTLVDLLLTNLVKNAFFHNRPNGSISIDVGDHYLSIANTSLSPAIPNEKLFQRFYKQSVAKDSWGLGLAMVKKICDINQWRISYQFAEGQHIFTVSF